MAANMNSIIPSFVRVTSQFTYPDNRSINGSSRPHKGIDAYAPAGTPVYSPNVEGVVVAVRNDAKLGGYGNYIVVATKLPDNRGVVLSVQGHLQELPINPSTGQPYSIGQSVPAGSIIGHVGNSGVNGQGGAYDVHLHYEQRIAPVSNFFDANGNLKNSFDWTNSLPVDPLQDYWGLTGGVINTSVILNGTALSAGIPGTPAPSPTDPSLAYYEITGDYTGRLYENGVVYYKNNQTGTEFWSVPTEAGGVVETTQIAGGAYASVEYTAAGTLDTSAQNAIQFAQQQNLTLSFMGGMTADLQAASNAGLQTLQDILNNDPLAVINSTMSGQGIEVISGGNTYTLTGGQLIQNVTDASGNVTGVNFLAGQLAGQTMNISADGDFMFTAAQMDELVNSGAFVKNLASTGTPIDTTELYTQQNFNGIIHTTFTETGTGNVIADITFQSQWDSGQRLGSITTVYQNNVITQTVDTTINGNTFNVTYTYDALTGEPVPHVNSINGQPPTDQAAADAALRQSGANQRGQLRI